MQQSAYRGLAIPGKERMPSQLKMKTYWEARIVVRSELKDGCQLNISAEIITEIPDRIYAFRKSA